MRNDEPTWNDVRDRVDNSFDNALAFPAAVYVFGLITQDRDLFISAILLWAGAVCIWTPWVIIRVLMGRPTGDGARAAAVLGIGLVPWIAAGLALEALSTRLGVIIAFPLIFAWGLATIVAAALQWPRRLSSRQRRWILALGGAVWGLFATLLLSITVFGGDNLGGFGAALGLLLGGLSALAAVKVTYAAIRGPARPAR